MKTYTYKGEVAPMSIHGKQLPGGDSSPSPMSFNKKKDGAQGGDLRPKGYQPKQVWGKM